MMTQSQKRIAEWPILIAIVWGIQILESSLSFYLGNTFSVHMGPIFISYLVLTRDMAKSLFLSVAVSLLFSPLVGFSGGIYISAQMWTALIGKSFVYAFALEGRIPFMILTGGLSMLFSVLSVSIMSMNQYHFSIWTQLWQLPITTLLSAGIAWLLYPKFVAWDLYFDHEPDDARKLDPGRLK